MLKPSDLLRMQSAQQSHMPDICHRSVYSRTTDDYGSPIESWAEDTTDIPCGINQAAGSEVFGATEMTVEYDATIRLPLSQADVWDAKDRLILTKMFGLVITPIVYEVASPVQRGPSAIRLLLRKVIV